MWKLFEKKQIIKELNKVPFAIKERYEIWKQTITIEGPAGLRKVRSFRDEALKGNWQGFRSSRLNRQWRIIYRVDRQLVEIYAIELTPHEY